VVVFWAPRFLTNSVREEPAWRIPLGEDPLLSFCRDATHFPGWQTVLIPGSHRERTSAELQFLVPGLLKAAPLHDVLERHFILIRSPCMRQYCVRRDFISVELREAEAAGTVGVK
jgi:hypothetical protein